MDRMIIDMLFNKKYIEEKLIEFFPNSIIINSRMEIISINTGAKSMVLYNANESIAILKKILEAAELENDSYEIFKERTNLNVTIIQTCQPFMKELRESNIKMRIQPSKEKIYANINKKLFKQVIHNIISNAIKFTPSEGKIVVKTFVNDEGRNRIVISDTGIGIPEKLQPMVFDRFTKAGRIGLKGEKSIGLGLSNVKQIIDLYGGDISLISSEKSGTTFFIDL